MHPLIGRLFKILLGILGLLALVLIAIISFFYVYMNRPLPPLIAHLSDDNEHEIRKLEDEGKIELTRRLNEQFPPGSLASSLEEELRKEGFNIESVSSIQDNLKQKGFKNSGTSSDAYIATYGRGVSVACGATWSVTWDPSTEGSITTVSGSVRYTCL